MARCPECGQKLAPREGLKRWDHFYCESCHVELEVLNPMPLELEALFEFEDEELIHDLNDVLNEEDDVDMDEDDEDEDEDDDEDDDDDDDDDEEEW